MAAGTMVTAPLLLLAAFGEDWQPPAVVVIAIIYVSIVGIAWLWEETQDAPWM